MKKAVPAVNHFLIVNCLRKPLTDAVNSETKTTYFTEDPGMG